jgi:mono/diheme cytochrome c family protein
LLLLAALGAVGCEAFTTASELPPAGEPRGTEDTPSQHGLVDQRPVVVASRTPRSISGGTLLALADGRRALVSDPDRDTISVVDFMTGVFTGILPLEQGAEPGRAVEDKSGKAFVVLRGAGEVLTIDLATGAAGERRKVCAAPRGIALVPSADRLIVACAEGKLVELPLAGTDSISETKASADVRDLVFSGKNLYVSRFRSAELQTLDAELKVTSERKLPPVGDILREHSPVGVVPGLFEAAVAWRAVPGPQGTVVIVHQRATADDIDIEHPSTDPSRSDGSIVEPGSSLVSDQSTYGASRSGCGGIVHSAVTMVAQDGSIVTSPQLGGVVLPVDVAVSRQGMIAVASAGTRDQLVPTQLPRGPAVSAITLLPMADMNRELSGSCLRSNLLLAVQEPVVAVAFDPVNDRLLAQTREPAQLIVFDNIQVLNPRVLPLPGDSALDTGHEIFHRDAGGGIACASCHAEGADDGRTWNFSPIGARRTQAIDVGLAGTEPFHWDGSLPTLDRLMNEVFVGRMGGPLESPQRVAAVEDWIFQLTPRAPLRAASDPAAQRGKELFESASVGCASCHSGPKFSNNQTVDVGSGGEFQVPSLIGIGQRVPVMHNGCAASLIDRFDASCGGTAHGNTSQLSQSQLEDLVAYLEAL